MQTVIPTQGRLAGAPGRPKHAVTFPLRMNEPELCGKIESLFVASFSGPGSGSGLGRSYMGRRRGKSYPSLYDASKEREKVKGSCYSCFCSS